MIYVDLPTLIHSDYAYMVNLQLANCYPRLLKHSNMSFSTNSGLWMAKASINGGVSSTPCLMTHGGRKSNICKFKSNWCLNHVKKHPHFCEFPWQTITVYPERFTFFQWHCRGDDDECATSCGCWWFQGLGAWKLEDDPNCHQDFLGVFWDQDPQGPTSSVSLSLPMSS